MEHPLTTYRRKAKVSRAELAALAATTRQTIHRIEAFKQNPSLGLMRRIIAATDGKVSADDFMAGAA